MKVAISLPDALFDRAEDSAARLGLNRSQLYARALEAYLQAAGADPVTARLNELADELADELGASDGRGAARRLVNSGAWEW